MPALKVAPFEFGEPETKFSTIPIREIKSKYPPNLVTSRNNIRNLQNVQTNSSDFVNIRMIDFREKTHFRGTHRIISGEK